MLMMAIPDVKISAVRMVLIYLTDGMKVYGTIGVEFEGTG